MNFGYANDLVIFGVDSRRNDNLRVLPVKHLSILLVKRNKEPDVDKWSLPGGFIDLNETSKEASIRVLKKETGLGNVYMQQIGVNDLVSRDSRGRIISTTYMALVDRTLIKNILKKSASWFDLEVQEEKNTIKINLSNADEKISFKVKRVVVDKKSSAYEYELIASVVNVFVFCPLTSCPFKYHLYVISLVSSALAITLSVFVSPLSTIKE